MRNHEKRSDYSVEEEKLLQEINRWKYKCRKQEEQKNELAKKVLEIKSSNSYKLASHLAKSFRSPKEFFGVFLFVASLIRSKAKKKVDDNIRGYRVKKDSERKKKLHESLVSQALNLPHSNGSYIKQQHNLSVGLITDEYMFNYYKDVFKEVHWLSPDNVLDILNKRRVDILLYVSCWKGGHNEEWRGHAKNHEKLLIIKEATQIAKQNDIYTVFQSIEDPSNFDHFLPVAKLFDHIFTSDEDMIPLYGEACFGSTVSYAEYGINPLFNNPVGMKSNVKTAAFFAGSYATRYKERCHDMKVIFDSIKSSGESLVVADRNSSLNNSSYRYPDRYLSNVIDGFPHHILQSVHKLFSININVNSIKNSPTMCAMRVYELQAQGTTIVSNYARSISNKFPRIYLLNKAVDFSRLMEYSSATQGYENAIRGVREVMTYKTAYEQTKNMLEIIKGEKEEEINKARVLCILPDGESLSTLRNIEGQSLDDIVQVDYKSCDALNADNIQCYDFVAPLGRDYLYGQCYLLDMYNAYKYVDVDFVTKDSFFDGGHQVPGKQHDYVSSIKDPYKTLFRADKFDIALLLSGSPFSLENGYSIDPFELNSDKLWKACKNPKDLELSVIIPVYNNGRFLLERCIPSLQLNDNFSSFELLIVDDGSTDQETLNIINSLEEKYGNARVFKFSGLPSGTASRARNKGLELSSCEFVTYLDPDNTISPGGYDYLLSEIKKNNNLDACLGYQYKVGEKVSAIGKIFQKPKCLVYKPRDELILEKSFPVVSTQAAVLRRSFLKYNEISYVEGAIGQDTLFGYEVLLAARNILLTHGAFIEYYYERSDSVTNSISVEFFERSLTLEAEQRKRLKKWGVWDEYLENRAKYFVEIWYGSKLKQFRGSKEDYKRVESILDEICAINELELEHEWNISSEECHSEA